MSYIGIQPGSVLVIEKDISYPALYKKDINKSYFSFLSIYYKPAIKKGIEKPAYIFPNTYCLNVGIHGNHNPTTIGHPHLTEEQILNPRACINFVFNLNKLIAKIELDSTDELDRTDEIVDLIISSVKKFISDGRKGR